VRWGGRPKPESIDEARIRGRVEIGEHGPEGCEIRAVEAGAVDLADGHDPDADRGGASYDRVEQRLALLVRHLLRVVEPRESANARAAERLVVEEHTGDDQRAGERPATRLVGARDEPDA
jgi:hypothetical protein